MLIPDLVGLAVVLCAGSYLVGLAGFALFSPIRAERFLGKLASSPFAHRLELLLRSAVGLAMLWRAPQMLFSHFFTLFGWVLILSSLMLLAMPWQWHQRFARMVVPDATRNLALFGLGSLAFGAFVLACACLGGGLLPTSGAHP